MIEIDCPITIPSNFEKNILREGENEYVFGCDEKFWNFPDSFKMCKLTDGDIEWLIETPSTNHGLILNSLRELIYENLRGRIMVSGSHFIPNLRNRLYCGEGPIKTTQLSLMVIDDIKRTMSNDVDYLILVDDLYMMYDYVKLNQNAYNFYRKLLFNPLVLPAKLANLINEYQAGTGNKFKVYYATEKTLADRFNRHIKTKKYRMGELFLPGGKFKEYSDDDWFVNAKGSPIQVISEHKPNCAAAIANLLRDVEYIVHNRKTISNYETLIAFFPSCSINNVLDGLKVASAVYNTNLTTYIIFTTTKCF